MTSSSSVEGLLAAKITAMLVLFVITALCGSIPFMLNCCFKWTQKQANARTALVVQCLLQFGGGVLLCTTFLHLLPEVQEIVDQLLYCQFVPELSFPLAETFMCAGFFLMYLIEECIHAYIHRYRRLLLEKEANTTAMAATAAFERGHSVRNSVLARHATTPEATKDLENCVLPTCEAVPIPVRYTDPPTNDSHVGHSHLPIDSGPGVAADEYTVTSSLRGLLIVLALSLHELFEGMSIGLEQSPSAVWFMFGAISAHKLILAFCVGMELLVARTRTMLCVVYLVTFSIVSPIGIGIGILISENQDATAPSLTSAILQGLACGTLVYVVFFEIISKEHAGFAIFWALLLGFLVMFGLLQFGDDDDNSDINCGAGSSVSYKNYKLELTYKS